MYYSEYRQEKDSSLGNEFFQADCIRKRTGSLKGKNQKGEVRNGYFTRS